MAKLETTDVTTELVLATNFLVAYVKILPGELSLPATLIPRMYVMAQMFENGYNKTSLYWIAMDQNYCDFELSTFFSAYLDPLWLVAGWSPDVMFRWDFLFNWVIKKCPFYVYFLNDFYIIQYSLHQTTIQQTIKLWWFC